MIEYIRILYERFKRAIYDNWVGVDTSGIYYIDSGVAAGHASGTYTISALHSEFTTFDFIVHAVFASSDTVFVAGTTGDDANAGTFALPKKTMAGAEAILDATHYQICIIEAGYYNGVVINEATLPAESLKVFTIGEIEVIFYIIGESIFALANIGSATDISWHNVKFDNYLATFTVRVGISAIVNFYFCENLDGDSIKDIKYRQMNSLDYSFVGMEGVIVPCIINIYNSIIYGSDGGFMFRTGVGADFELRKIYNSIIIGSYFADNLVETDNGDFQQSIFYQFKAWIESNNFESGCTFEQIIFSNCVPLSDTSITNSIITYSCSNIQLLPGTGNVQENPAFIQNSPVKSEDFKLRTKALGYLDDSPCYLTGNLAGTENIGAWQGIASALYSFRKYDIQIPPEHFLTPLLNVGYQAFAGGGGNIETVRDGTKRTIAIIYGENILTGEDDVCFIDYISSRAMFQSDDPLNVVQSDLITKFFPDIDNSKCYGNILSIANKIIKADTINYIDGENGLIIADNFRHDQFTGYMAWLITKEDLSVTLSGQTISGLTGMVVDEYISFWACIWNATTAKMIYHISANTTTELTLEDYYENLVDETYSIFIFKEFRIDKMINDTFTIYDPNNEIPNTIESYEIQCINAVSTNTNMNYQIIGYVKNNIKGYPRTAITRTFQQV